MIHFKIFSVFLILFNKIVFVSFFTIHSNTYVWVEMIQGQLAPSGGRIGDLTEWEHLSILRTQTDGAPTASTPWPSHVPPQKSLVGTLNNQDIKRIRSLNMTWLVTFCLDVLALENTKDIIKQFAYEEEFTNW